MIIELSSPLVPWQQVLSLRHAEACRGVRSFFTISQGRAFGAPAGTASAALLAETARHQAAGPARHLRSAARASGVRRRWRRQRRRFLRAAALRRGGCLARSPRTRSLAVQAAAPGGPRLQELTAPSPLAPAILSPGQKITVKGARCARVLRMALRATTGH